MALGKARGMTGRFDILAGRVAALFESGNRRLASLFLLVVAFCSLTVITVGCGHCWADFQSWIHAQQGEGHELSMTSSDADCHCCGATAVASEVPSIEPSLDAIAQVSMEAPASPFVATEPPFPPPRRQA